MAEVTYTSRPGPAVVQASPDGSLHIAAEPLLDTLSRLFEGELEAEID